MPQKSLMRGVLQNLLSAVTTGTSAVMAVPSGLHYLTAFITGSSGVSAGKVKIEGAPSADYAGTWALIGSEITVGDDTTQTALTEGTYYPFVRARVSTDVVGGTVSVDVVGN